MAPQRDEKGLFLKGTGGRPKGAKNKVPIALADTVLNALDGLGGEEYLIELGREKPEIFVRLIEKLLPSRSENQHEIESRGDVKIVFSADHAIGDPQYSAKVQELEARAEITSNPNGNSNLIEGQENHG